MSAATALLLLAACAERQTAPGPHTLPPPPGQPIAPPPPQIVSPTLFQLKGEVTQGTLLYGTAPKDTALLLLDGKPLRFAADGRFVIGLNRDAPPTALLEARLADGRLLRLPLTVTPRQWDISNLPTLQRGGTATPAQKRIRDAEIAQIAAAKAVNAESDGWRGPWAWPAVGRISTLFGSQRTYANGVSGAPHGGIDIARPTGWPALAPADGVVVLVTDHPFTLEGNMVMIDHGMGLVSAIMHLSAIEVVSGQRVTRGEEIGKVGMTGSATGPHLHWGVTWNASARLDPLLIVGPMPKP
ncbi:hypothetical protein FHS31_001961 [Sphingomonas vulcanisoli]|uniref:M23ase beta-sheet core domain-containing protein n=1 Tax=Sphingomonas vulcanisoli TaxID=1658060 RepID=A0ABX0TVZ4_9SPHN|nr:M23 family metallopeptidase [Sphingomonas vulcanisoli]NIJ08344.1 hypothetical protein [Sphingomonas vulcanisoli]